jgi:hypothetical protein
LDLGQLKIHLPFGFGLEFSGVFGEIQTPENSNTMANGKRRTKNKRYGFEKKEGITVSSRKAVKASKR